MSKHLRSGFMRWLDGQLRKDPEFKRKVDEAWSAMRIEQDLAELREQRGLSRAQLAKRIGMSQRALARLEAGRAKNLALRTLARYAAAVGAQIKIEVTQLPSEAAGNVVPIRAVRPKAGPRLVPTGRRATIH